MNALGKQTKNGIKAAKISGVHLAPIQILQELNGAKTVEGTRRALAIARLFGSAKTNLNEKAKTWGKAGKVLQRPLPPNTSVMAASFILLWAVIGLASAFGQWGDVAAQKYSQAALVAFQTQKINNAASALGEKIISLNPLGQDPQTTVVYYHAPKLAALPSAKPEVLGEQTFNIKLARVTFKKLSIAEQEKIQNTGLLLLSQYREAEARVNANINFANANAGLYEATPLPQKTKTNFSKKLKQIVSELEDGLGNEYLTAQYSLMTQAKQLTFAMSGVNFYYIKSQQNIAASSIATLNSYSSFLGELAFKFTAAKYSLELACNKQLAGIHEQAEALGMDVEILRQVNAFNGVTSGGGQ